MPPLQPHASLPLSTSSNRNASTRPPEEVVYKVMTVAAILMVLGSLWLF